jgi:hypothetical protein
LPEKHKLPFLAVLSFTSITFKIHLIKIYLVSAIVSGRESYKKY